MPRTNAPPPLFVLRDPVARDDIGMLCASVAPVLERSRAGPLICDVGGVRRPDAVTIETLARLGLTARRQGRRMQLRGACDELTDLLALIGLSDTFPSIGAGSGVETVGQPEQGEQPLGVQEEADPVDPVA
jgi:ABC-type transporter Mla MlaB component